MGRRDEEGQIDCYNFQCRKWRNISLTAMDKSELARTTLVSLSRPYWRLVLWIRKWHPAFENCQVGCVATQSGPGWEGITCVGSLSWLIGDSHPFRLPTVLYVPHEHMTKISAELLFLNGILKTWTFLNCVEVLTFHRRQTMKHRKRIPRQTETMMIQSGISDGSFTPTSARTTVNAWNEVIWLFHPNNIIQYYELSMDTSKSFNHQRK